MKPYSITSFRLIIIFLGAFSISSQGLAATKYVSNSGNNANSGNSFAQAWLTIQWAEDHITAGDSVWVQNGTYAGFDVRVSGNAANPIVFIAAGNTVVINTPTGTTDLINVENVNYIEINGFRAINSPRNGIRLVNADNCIVRNNYCESSFERGIFTGFTDDILIEFNECLTSDDEHGIYVSNSSDRSIIRYNICHNNNRGGIQINADFSIQPGDGISTDPEIYGNILYENGAAGGAAINLDGVQSALIYNNLLYQNHATGIALFQQDGAEPSINATIVYNTIINASNARWCILAVNGSSGAQVYNNIIINLNPASNRGAIALDPDAVAGFVSNYNILTNRLSRMGDGSSVPLSTWKGYGYDLNSVVADPLADIFVSPGSDYHLAEGSQAINFGNASFSFGVNSDIEGVSRPQGNNPDVGAYESEFSLAIGEEEEYPGYPGHENPGILVEHQKISWNDGLDGIINLINIEGKLLRQSNIATPGELSLTGLIPGIYLLTVHDDHGVQWSTWVRVLE
ncbi:MAG: right-handed parallel beta-helix repeat-containing protein [Bacteroidota bacterium]|nr:right-handed parallel beta-helix repeat-containing protein [Bacteroidota bacterium]